MDLAVPPLSIEGLRDMARQSRIDTARMFMAAGNGHFGSFYSCADIVTVLYFAHMRIDPARPDWPDRDRFLLSKGHAAPTLYSALIRRGFIPESWLDEYETHVGSRLMTHPSRRYQPGVDASLGALGYGLSIGIGMTLAARMDARDYVTYVLMGDGEINEGSVWEAAMAAVAEVAHGPIRRIGIRDTLLPIGPTHALHASLGLSADNIVAQALSVLGRA